MPPPESVVVALKVLYRAILDAVALVEGSSVYVDDFGALHPPQRGRLLHLSEDALVLLADVRVLGALLLLLLLRAAVLARLPIQADLAQAAL